MSVSRTHASFLRIQQGETMLFKRQLLQEFTRFGNKWSAMVRRMHENIGATEDFTYTLLNEHADRLREIVRRNDVRIMRAIHSRQMEMLGEKGGSSLDRSLRSQYADMATRLSQNAVAGTRSRTQSVLNRGLAMVSEDAEPDRGIAYVRERLLGGMGRNRVRTIAETEGHRAGNAAIELIGNAFGDRGWKQWQTRKDGRVRPSHRAVRNVVKHTGETFKVGDSQLLHPGDPNGPAKEVINCRCYLRVTARRPRNARSQ